MVQDTMIGSTSTQDTGRLATNLLVINNLQRYRKVRVQSMRTTDVVCLVNVTLRDCTAFIVGHFCGKLF